MMMPSICLLQHIKCSIITKIIKNIFCLIVLAILFPNESFGNNESLNHVLKPYNISISGNEAYQVICNQPSIFKEKIIHIIIAKKEYTRLKLEIIHPCTLAEAEIIKLKQHTTLKDLYYNYTIPYNDIITIDTKGPELKKAYFAKLSLSKYEFDVLVGNASPDFTFGIWNDSEITNTGVYTSLYNEKLKTFYNINIFQPTDIYDIKNVITILKDFVKSYK